MLSSRPIALFAAAILLVACRDTAPTAPAAVPIPTENRGARPAIDRHIVVFRDSVQHPAALAQALARTHGASLRHVWTHGLRGFSAQLSPAAVDALRRNPSVQLVTPVKIGQFADHSTQAGATWGLDRVDQRARPLENSYTYNATGAGVNAYIIDSGIFPEHQEFGSRASILYDARPEDALAGRDCFGHGTHVAGTVGSARWGVAKGVRLYGVKVTVGCINSVDSDDLIEGIDYVIANHIKPAVANISIRFPVDAAIDLAVQHLIDAGVTVVVAAANENGDSACNWSPGRVSAAITVGATDMNDVRAGFSNVGPCVDLFAPGVDITSAGLFSVTDDATSDGTSFASPHVAGAAALILESNASAAPSAVWSTILGRATLNLVTNAGSGSPNRLLYTLPPLTAAIDGRSYISSPGTYTWDAVTTGGVGHVTYLWERINTSGYTTRHTIGTGPSESIYINGGPDFYLILTVTSANQSVTVQHFVNNATIGSCTFRC